MSTSGTPVGLGYGDFRDRDGRVSNPVILYSIVYVGRQCRNFQASALGVKLPQFPPVPHAVHSVSRGHLIPQQNLQPPSVSLSQKLTERVEYWFGESVVDKHT